MIYKENKLKGRKC